MLFKPYYIYNEFYILIFINILFIFEGQLFPNTNTPENFTLILYVSQMFIFDKSLAI